MMEEISGSLKGRFVDDDDIVRTGRAMIEVDGWDFLHIPIPVGLSGKLKSFESAMDSRLVKSRKDAEAAASSAGEAADSAEEARGSASAAEASAGRASGSESAAAESESTAQGHAKTAEGHANAAQEQVSVARGQAESASASAEEARGHATTAEGHASRAQQSAEESSRAADRAEGARGEARAAWDGAKEARDAAEGHASTAEGHATAAASSAGDAQGAAGRADESAQQVREIAESTHWDGDQVTVNGKQSPHLRGPQGERGRQGPPGTVEGIDFEQYAKVEQLSDVVRRGQDGVEMGKHFSLVHDGSGNFSTSLFLKNGQHEYEFFTNSAGKFGAWDKTNQRGLFQADRNVFEHQTAVDMRNNQLRGLPAPSGDNHAATKSYVDGRVDDKQDKSKVLDELSNLRGTTSNIGGGASGILSNGVKVLITSVDGYVTANDPRDRRHVANKQYVDKEVEAVRDRVGALESGGAGGGFWAGTQAAYNRESKDSNTLYVITG
nr:MAG TPA: PROTEIN (MANNOSE-BINDING PROTEIN A), HOST DEFENSE, METALLOPROTEIN, SUGAR.9A [Caudoviricetes sp.]